MKFLLKKSNSITHASLILIVVASLSKVFGLFRELVIAFKFGAGQELDNYIIAVTVPTFIISILMYTIQSAVIPKLSAIKLKKGNNEFWKANTSLIIGYFFILLFLAFIIFLLAPTIIKLLSPSITENNFNNATNILKILSVYLFFGGIYPILRSISQADKHFFIPAIAPFSIHFFIIVSILFFADQIGNLSIAFGLCLGAILQILIFVIFFIKRKIPFNWHFNIRTFNNIQSTIFVVLIIEMFGQSFSIIDRYFASHFVEGSISSLNYAMTITKLPINIFGLSVGAAIFPTLSEIVAKNDYIKITSLIKKSLLYIIILSIPITIVYYFYSDFIIKIIFERGKFDSSTTIRTANILKYYAFGIIALMMHTIFAKIFYSLKLEKVLLAISFIAILSKILLSFFFQDLLGTCGLALSTSLTFIVSVILLTIILVWKLQKKNI